MKNWNCSLNSISEISKATEEIFGVFKELAVTWFPEKLIKF